MAQIAKPPDHVKGLLQGGMSAANSKVLSKHLFNVTERMKPTCTRQLTACFEEALVPKQNYKIKTVRFS